MYGTLDQLERIWIILERIDDIIEGIDSNSSRLDYFDFQFKKGFGAKSGSTRISEKKVDDPYMELVKLWKEYKDWKVGKLRGD